MPIRRSSPSNATPGRVLLAVVAFVVVVALAVVRLSGVDTAIAPDLPVACSVPDAVASEALAFAIGRPEGAVAREEGRAASVLATAQGRVVDVAGKGVAGVAIGRADGACGGAVLATSARDGAFAVDGVAAGSRLVSCDARWQTIAAATVDADASIVVVVAPLVTIKGNVIDADGRPIEGAMLAIAVPVSGGDTADRHGTQWLTFSDRDGVFAFAAAPGIAAAQLSTQHPDHLADERALPLGASSVTVVLRTKPSPEPVQGTLFGPDGAPFANANVRMGDTIATSGADGTFALDASRQAVGTPLFVMAAGCAPVAVDDPRVGDGRTPQPLVVSLWPEVAIEGRLVDANGMPLREWTVVLADPTPRDPGRPFAGFVEGELGALRVVTDDTGHFTIGGVFARRYAIEAWDRRGERGLRAAIAPADGLVTLVAHERDATTLRGIVVDGDGRPVAGVVVGEQRPGCLASGALAMRFDHRVTTGADGRFELPLRGAALQIVVDGAAIVARCIPLPAAIGDAPLCVEVARRRDVFVGDAGTGELALVPVDGSGRTLPACEPSSGTRGVPTTTRGLVVHRHGVPAGMLPLPANGDRLDLRLQPRPR